MATVLLGLKRKEEKGTAAYSTESLPLGFRFSPTDVELIDHYLRLKNEDRESEVQIIGEVDFYAYEPWDLPELSVIKSDQREWFFFCRRYVHPDPQQFNSDQNKRDLIKSSEANAFRLFGVQITSDSDNVEITSDSDNVEITSDSDNLNQLVCTTPAGYWDPIDEDCSIELSCDGLTGMKKTSVFYKGRAPNGTRTDWIMHEYSATTTKGDLVGTSPHQDAFVLCHLFQKGWPDDIGDNIRDNNKVCQAHSSAIAFDLPSDMTFDLPSDMTFESSNTGVLDLLNKAALQDVDYLAPSFEGLWATNQFICEICNKGFQEDQNLQLHRRDHDLQWKLPQRTNEDFWVVLNESLPETSGEEGIEKQITSESQGVAIDLLQPNSSERSKEVKVEFDLFGQDEKFEIEEPETSDMDWTTFSVSLEFFHQREVLQSCLMWGGLGLTEPPKEEDWKNAKKIYLMDNELSDLPKNPRCPVLSTLFLQRNYKLRTIPPSFFDHMPSLQILNLSRTGIKSLPESILRLVSLKRLFLNDCHRFMILSPKVGALEQLEVLDLEGTDIMDLPKEIKELTNLTCLEVSFCAYLSNVRRAMQSEVVVPCGIISALSHLEELNMSVNPDDKRWNACVEAIVIEVCTLQSLNTLKFYFPRVELVRHFLLNSPMWVHPSLSHFRFTVGHHVKRTMSRLPHDVEFELEQWERCLKYINGVAIPTEIKEILQYSTAFFLERHATVNKLSDFGIGNMKQLKCCVMGECNEVEVIIDETNARKEDGEADAIEDDDEVDACEEDDRNEIVSKTSGAKTIVLGSLEYLYIYYMKNLRRIWEGPAQPKCLSLLKSLTLRTCPQLTTIFTIGLLNNLYNLEELTVEDCPSIKNLVSCENFAEHKTSDFLPNLKRISLHYMPGLISISVGLHIAPRLEWLSFYNCPNLKHLLIEEVSSKALKRIKGEWNWWVALKWRSGRPSYLDDIFVPINI